MAFAGRSIETREEYFQFCILHSSLSSLLALLVGLPPAKQKRHSLPFIFCLFSEVQSIGLPLQPGWREEWFVPGMISADGGVLWQRWEHWAGEQACTCWGKPSAPRYPLRADFLPQFVITVGIKNVKQESSVEGGSQESWSHAAAPGWKLPAC